MKPLIESSRARLDVADILNYLIAANPAAAIRIYDAYAAALESIQKMPLAGGNLLLPELIDLELRYCRPKVSKTIWFSIASPKVPSRSFACSTAHVICRQPCARRISLLPIVLRLFAIAAIGTTAARGVN